MQPRCQPAAPVGAGMQPLLWSGGAQALHRHPLPYFLEQQQSRGLCFIVHTQPTSHSQNKWAQLGLFPPCSA